MQSELAGKAGPEVDRVLRDVIGRIEAIPDPAGRAAERMRVFGTESARALAGLTSGGLARATVETDGLASAIGEAADNSAAMDESAARLSSSLDRLAVVVGDALAPNTVAAMDALAGLVTVLGTAAEAGGGLLRVLTPPGLAGMMWEYATATEAAAQQTRQLYDDFGGLAARMEGEGGGEILMDLWRVDESERPGREAAAAAARKRAQEVAAATAEVQRQAREEGIWGEASRLEEIARMAEQGAAMQAVLDEEDRREHEARLARIAEEVEAQRALRLARIASTQAIVSGAADAIAAIDETSRAAKMAGFAESLVNFGTAITAAYAQGGPLGGPALASLVVGQLAPVISSMRALVGGGAGAGLAIGRRGGGSGATAGRGRQGVGLDAAASAVVVAEYRGDVYDAQTRDAARRAGSPLRDIVRQRRIAR
jgi:hypothetical protein